MIITDGSNEDPARLAVLITLGITEDADAAVLKQISSTTPAAESCSTTIQI